MKLVEITLDLLESGRRAFKVKVRWAKDPRFASHSHIDPAEMGTAEAARQKILLVAGYLAEKHCEEYGDTLDPDLAVRMASEELRRCLMEEAQRMQMNGAKR